jgi:hypothetical protein
VQVGKGEFSADVSALNTFVQALTGKQGLISAITSDKALQNQIGSLGTATSAPAGPLDFGQDIPNFMSAKNMVHATGTEPRYDGNYAGLVSNYNAFLNSLTVLAEAASTIAKNYSDTATADSVNARTVQQAIDNAPLPSPQTTPSSQPGTQS